MNCQPPKIISAFKNFFGEKGEGFCCGRRGRQFLYSLIALILWYDKANNFGMII